MTDMPTNWCPLAGGCAYACSGRRGCEAYEVRAPRRSIADCGLLIGTASIVVGYLAFVLAPIWI